VFSRIETYDSHSFIDQTRKLARTQMAYIVDAAAEDVIVKRSTAPLEPSEQRLACFGHKLKLHGPASFLLDGGQAVSDGPANGNVPRFE
jgi:hypothetical protein